MKTIRSALAFSAIAILIIGCGTSEPAKSGDGIEAVRAKLSPEERTAVEAQEWCAVSTDERLGSMGPPIKIELKGQSVFLCCNSCKKKAEADPDKALAKVAELKAKVSSLKETKK